MLSVDQAQAHLLSHAKPLPLRRTGLKAARDRIVQQDVIARRTHPPFAASAMDGYACHAADVHQPMATLRLIGESAAGHRFPGVVGRGETVRIFTGAPVPTGADYILLQEDAVREGTLIRVREAAGHPGVHIRAAGLDIQQGAVILRAGTRLTPPRLGLLAAAGMTHIPLCRAPIVELLACGNELKLPGQPLGPDDIVSSNGVMLTALLEREGARVRGAARIVPDDLTLLTEAVRASRADILVTIGGASVGDHDHVHAALEAASIAVDFWKVALRPGKPMLVGRRGAQLILGLPGNPVSAFVCAQLFLLPVVRSLLGDIHPLPLLIQGCWAVPMPANGSRAEYLRATIRLEAGITHVTPLPLQDSSMLSVLSAADVLALRPANAPPARIGDPMSMIMLDANMELN